MLVVDHVVAVDAEKCIGCKACDRVCPTSAIVTIDRLARVDEAACTGCNKCITECAPYGAIKRKFLDQPIVLKVPEGRYDEAVIDSLCAAAHFHMDAIPCPCTGTTAREIAIAILDGATTIDEVTVASGARGVCSVWCTAGVMRLMTAGGLTVPDQGKNWRLYPDGANPDVSIWGISDEIARKYPEYRLEACRERLKTTSLAQTSSPTIRGGQKQ